ncbi:uncharacterized protein LOC131307377 isoform X2 [Rhododendron vialii]|uniref:uncharacterized protein LOC131307377 isoform X2 n=1 Tax=Rhododendron vialii TaxID=182163 RepID=UPI00265DAFC2|nr:uncharacterized protein LOC131307377 isoform X2 [Rhododendron vialii]
MTCRTTTTTALNLIATPSKPVFSVALAGKFPHNCPIKSRRLSRVRFRSPTSLNHERPYKRHRFVPKARYSSSSEAVELPLLPFPMDQVLVPSETKTLHLYEARYLSLLDESLFGTNKHFVHFVLDPIGINDTAEASFAARYGCLVLIEKVERLDVGALVSIRGVGRVKIVKIVQANPYLRGAVIPMQDVVPDSLSKVTFQVVELKEALHCLNGLEIKLKAPKEALMQTQIANAVEWAEKESSVDSYGAFFPSSIERLCFSGLQPVSGGTPTELRQLQREKLRAMEVKDTLERLNQSLEFVRNNISMVAAKLAIQSLGSQ